MIKRAHLSHIGVIQAVLLAVLLACSCALALATPKAYAVSAIDPNRDTSLKIEALHDGVPIQGMVFNIYHVANINADGSYTLTDAFKKYPVDINTTDVAQMANLGTTLKGYIARDAISPSESGMTDAAGSVQFSKSSGSGGLLPQGLYLVVGLDAQSTDKIYKSAPFFVSLPHKKDASSSWLYDVVATAKLTVTERPSTPQGLTITAVKQWVENEGGATRPTSITIDLIRDGQVFDTRMLSAENNWSAEWKDLEQGHEWTVVEKEIEGYTVSVEVTDFNFVITNTEKPGTPPDTPPDTPPGTPSTPTPSSDKPSLPKTGVLWWPVAAFGGAGLVLLFISILVGRRKKTLPGEGCGYQESSMGKNPGAYNGAN